MVMKSTSLNMVLGECGRYPLQCVYTTKVIKYWCHVMQLPRDRSPYQSYKMLKSLDECGRITWASKVKHIPFQFGFAYAWFSHTVGNKETFISMFNQWLCDN